MARTNNKADSIYKNEHQKETYDVIKVLTPKGTKNLLKEYLKGKSLSSYTWDLIQEDLKKNGVKGKDKNKERE